MYFSLRFFSETERLDSGTDLSASIEEKEKNASDPRIIESMYEELDALKAEQADGLENIDNFKIPPLPYGATERCIIAQN